MKNYKNLEIKKLIPLEDKLYALVEIPNKIDCELFYCDLDSLPDQEPKECEHDHLWGVNHGAVCRKCGQLVPGPKDLPKLPEKLEENRIAYHKDDPELIKEITGSNMNTVIKTINQILDYLKNNSN